MKPYLAIVEWEDACNYVSESLHDVDIKEPELVRTFGIVSIKSSSYVVVCTHDGGESSDFMKVPTSLVRSIKKLALKEPEHKIPRYNLDEMYKEGNKKYISKQP